MFDFLKIQYQLGHIDQQKLESFVGVWITQQEYQSIVAEKQER